MTSSFFNSTIAISTIAGLFLIRSIWMRLQARRAIKEWLAEHQQQQHSIRSAQLFRDMCSVWLAFSSLTLDYEVVGQTEDGEKKRHFLAIHFMPIIGLLRRIDDLKFDSVSFSPEIIK